MSREIQDQKSIAKLQPELTSTIEGAEDTSRPNASNRAIKFPITPLEDLKDRPFPKTAACLVIGDEILNGKTVDTNSGYFAKFCFDLGIDVKRIEVIPDEEDTIIEAVRRLSSNYDFVVTSGGVGSTHDDITYPSIAHAFGLELVYHKQTMDRMIGSMKNHPLLKKKLSAEVTTANKRMTLFPTPSLVVYPNETIWVPIVIVNNNVHILPGIPSLFRGLLGEFDKYFAQQGEKFIRVFVRTYQPESFIAPVLTEVQKKVAHLGVKVGSYPKWTNEKRWVVVSFLAREKRKSVVEELAKEVAEKINGYIINTSDDPEESEISKL
ncbi:12503_t:CDS:2 [Ambispora gerdemannii]|uniref:12503_t:CDS:1 n=1 Tax=Ambispora gerdemannii TaxID=144530 RepID=A0A9N9D296_9GLOM|nr:12503_t:CDS:2 [Ambispora gerdemannii]